MRERLAYDEDEQCLQTYMIELILHEYVTILANMILSLIQGVLTQLQGGITIT